MIEGLVGSYLFYLLVFVGCVDLYDFGSAKQSKLLMLLNGIDLIGIGQTMLQYGI